MKLKNLLGLLGLLLIPALFIGEYYDSMGNWMVAVLRTLAATVILIILLWGAVACLSKQGAYKRIVNVLGCVLIAFYAAVAIVYVSPRVFLAFGVNERKDDIRAKITDLRDNTNNMFSAYKKQCGDRTAQLKSIIDAYETSPSGRSVLNAAFPGIVRRSSFSADQAKGLSSYLLQVYQEDNWAENREKLNDAVIDNWSPFRAVSQVAVIAKLPKSYYEDFVKQFDGPQNDLERYLVQHPSDSASRRSYEFDYPMPDYYGDLKSKFSLPQIPTIGGALFFLVFFLFSLLPFIFVSRNRVRKMNTEQELYENAFPVE